MSSGNYGFFGFSTADAVLTFEELDGAPSLKNLRKVLVSNGTLTDNGDNTATLATGSGGGSGITQLTGDVTAGPGSGSQPATLANTTVTPGSYTSADITVDSKGRITTAANGSGGSGTTETGNFIKNASFENWENGTAAAPDAWVLTGASATVAREGTIIKHGLYSAKLTRSGTDCNLMQDIYVPGGSTFVRSRQYTFGAWVYATVASRARLRIDDGSTVTNSSYHTGGSTWEWLTVTATLGAAITTFKVGLQVDTGNTDGYIDGIAIVEASSLAAKFYPSILPFNDFPLRATLFHDQSLATAGNAVVALHDGNQDYSHYALQNTPANGDTFTQGFWLRAGTYTLKILCATGSGSGLLDLYIDNVGIATGQDFYTAGTGYNTIKTINSVAVVGDGYHVLKGTVNGKNGSSSGFGIALTKMWLVPSAD